MAQDKAKHWLDEIERYTRKSEAWRKDAKRIVKRYRAEDKRQSTSDGYSRGRHTVFNVLWSNVQTMKPALFSSVPQVIAERRHRDPDLTGRLASEVVQRAVEVEMECNGFRDAMNRAVLDVLLTGRGTVWARFEAEDVPDTPLTMNEREDMDEMGDPITVTDYSTKDGVAVEIEQVTILDDGSPVTLGGTTNEKVMVDYVHWDDFAHSLDRTWSDVKRRGWVGRRAFLTRDEIVEMFGQQFRDVQLTSTESGYDDDGMGRSGDSKPKYAEVWEIWDARSKDRIFVAKGEDRILKRDNDPFNLEGFFPCPAPVYATVSNDSLIPVPDYRQYEALANELDMISSRILKLTEMLKMRGIYAGTAEAIGRLLKAADGEMVAVTDASVLRDGGVSALMDFAPLLPVLQTLQGLYESRERSKNELYEISGVSDILRGAVDPREKAAQSRIKAQYAGQRLDQRRRAVEMMARDTARIIVELMSEMYPDELLREKSGYDYMPEVAKLAETGEADAVWQAVTDLLKSDEMRTFRVDVETDSTIELDQGTEKESRAEFLGEMGVFMEKAVALLQADPNAAQLLSAFMLFAARGYRTGRPVESAIEEYWESFEQRMQEQQQAEAAAAQAQAEAEAQAQTSAAPLLESPVVVQ